MSLPQDLLLGVSDQLFLRSLLSIVALALSLGSWLFKSAVGHLAKISSDLSELKASMAVMVERSANHGQRLERLETTVYNPATVAK